MSNILNFIGFFVFVILFFGVVIDNIRMRHSLKKLETKIKQEVLDYTIRIENEVKELKEKKDPEPKEDDGFLKFVADSRNWAYAYIENVQAGIWNFKQRVGGHLEYFDEYSSVMETPLHPAMRDISLAYKELIKFIPEDYGKIEE